MIQFHQFTLEKLMQKHLIGITATLALAGCGGDAQQAAQTKGLRLGGAPATPQN